MRMRIQFFLIVVVAGCLAGCSKQFDRSHPWVVVLDEASNQALAEKLLASYENKKEAALEGASALAVVDHGVLRYLVVSRGFKQRAEAEKLAGQLAGSSRRLTLLDVSKLAIPEEQSGQFGGIPDDLQDIEKLAALLPAPGARTLDSFLFVRDAAKSCREPVELGATAPDEWRRAFCSLGFSATAEAAYGVPGSGGSKRVLVFIGIQNEQPGQGKAQGAQKQDLLQAGWDFLATHTAPSPEEWERIQKERKSARHRRRHRRRRRRRAKAAVEDKKDVEAPTQLPAPQQRRLPWGDAQVYAMQRVILVPSGRYREQTPEWTAWLATLPYGRGIWLALFNDENGVENLLRPVGLGESHGIVYLPEFSRPWTLLPEVGVEDEHLVFIGAQRFGRWLPTRQRHLGWAKRNGQSTITGAGFAAGEKHWQVDWIDLGSEAESKLVFNEGFVAPRQAIMQRVLKSKRRVRYDLGVSLVEVGDTNAWFFKGARHGHRKEMYFSYKTRVWLFLTPQNAKTGLAQEDLMARAELLQIWDAEKQ